MLYVREMDIETVLVKLKHSALVHRAASCIVLSDNLDFERYSLSLYKPQKHNIINFVA